MPNNDFQAPYQTGPWRARFEFIAVSFALMWAIIYPIITPYAPVDLQIFINAGAGRDMTGFYYAPWSLPFFALFDMLPLTVAAIVTNVLSWAGFLYATNIFKGNKIVLFTSYPLLMLMYYGQVDGIYAFGLAAMYVALKNRRDFLASVFWLIAIIKFYVGIPLGLGLWLYYAKDNRSRLRVAIWTAGMGLVSFLLWPNWLMDLLQRASEVSPNQAYSMDTWRIFGPVVVLLWLPLLISRRKDFIWWTVTWFLTVPYVYVWSLTFLAMLPVGWISWGLHLSYVMGFVVSTVLQLIPLAIYLWRLWLAWQAHKATTQLKQDISAVSSPS